MATQHQYHFKIILILLLLLILLVVFSNWATGRYEGSRGLIFRQ